MPHQRAGLYAWGGPGTTRLLHTKYFSPNVDTDSFLTLYDFATLKKLQDALQLTDVWATASWGFGDKKEQEDWQFLLDRVPNFHRLGIKVHAYIQGWNLVTSDFPKADFWALDGAGRKMAYSKGRAFTCVNHPEFQRLFLDRVTRAAESDVDGVFIDNILFGLPPAFIRKDLLPACGCRCTYCRNAFQKQFDYALAHFEIAREQDVRDFLAFRCESTFNLLEKAKKIAHIHNKQFGVNFYDPLNHTPEIFYGYELEKVLSLVEYVLIENHGLPTDVSNNEYLRLLTKLTKKPIFVVSYKEGIGFEGAYTPEDFATIRQESKDLGFSPCYKGTEFTTDGVWHAVRPDQLPTKATQPRVLSPQQADDLQTLSTRGKGDMIRARIFRSTAWLMNMVSDHPLVGRLVFTLGLQKVILHAKRRYAFNLRNNN